MSNKKKAIILAHEIRFGSGNPYALHNGEELEYDTILKSNVEACDASLEEVIASRKLLQDPYAYIDDQGNKVGIRASMIDTKNTNTVNFNVISDKEMEIKAHVKELQISLWREQKTKNPFDILSPELALNFLGYEVEEYETLGNYKFNGFEYEVAGSIDNTQRTAHLSMRFPYKTRRFTLAHELGHAVLHSTMMMSLHRDRPVTNASKKRDLIEQEADIFATNFLMPEKLVIKEFYARFQTEKFTLSEEVAFAMQKELQQLNHLTRRELSKLLACSKFYNGKHFTSLSERFEVSVETMAIRIEELFLV